MPLSTAALANERTDYFTPDNVRYTLHAPPDRLVLTEEGLGLPTINYVTQRGPYQHGDTVRDYFLAPRIIQMVVRHSFCSRKAYWEGRAQLLDIIRPNRGGGNPGIGILRKILPGGVVRDICCVIQQGPNFGPRAVGITGSNVWDEWAYAEALRFVADDPIWYDPKGVSVLIGYPFSPDPGPPPPVGTFPMTFPVTFGGVAPVSHPVHTTFDTITYVGTWKEYPTITITGPIDAIAITNTTLNERVGIVYPLPSGRSIVIDLTPGAKAIRLDDGTNLLQYVTLPTDLSRWHLEPGPNVIQVDYTNGDAFTSVTIAYRNRYIGI